MKTYFSKIFLLLTFVVQSLNLAGQHGWVVNPSAYTYSGEVVAVVINGGSEATTGTLGGFVDDICRGFTDGMYFPPTGKTVFILLCYSNQMAGETLTFQYYDPSTGSYNNIVETIPFVSDMREGNAESPLQFHICNPVSITTQPVSASMCASSGSESFTVAVAGTPP